MMAKLSRVFFNLVILSTIAFVVRVHGDNSTTLSDFASATLDANAITSLSITSASASDPIISATVTANAATSVTVISDALPSSGSTNPTGIFQTALVVATDSTAAAAAVEILQGYGQPLQLLTIPQNGAPLPPLETNNADGTSVGNYGLIVIVGLCAYDYGGAIGWKSAITTEQFNAIYTYQVKYGVRAIYLDSYPDWFEGVTVAPGPVGCCNSQEQYVYILNPSLVPTAGLRVADMSTIGLWHYPAIITNTTTTTAFMEFAANGLYNTKSDAGVIQNINGREQMIFFLEGGSWSLTTNYLYHIWFHWGYRGLYNGYRRVALHQQGRSYLASRTNRNS